MKKNIIFFLFYFIIISFVFAEGTKQIQPTDTSKGRLQIMPFYSDFAMVDATDSDRLYISIGDTSETIFFGFGDITDYFFNLQLDVTFQIKDPDGVVVLGPLLIVYSGAGYIENYEQAVAGPNIINPLGYNPIEYNPTKVGDYYIEFNFTQPHNTQRKIFKLLDITVVSATNEAIEGRLWSKNWQMTALPSLTSNPFESTYDGKYFIYSDDGVVTSVDLNNMQPLVFNISANQTGCFNTGNYLEDRKSVDGNYTHPQYKLFLNEPDSILFPVGEMGMFTQPSTITGCPGDYCLNVYVNKTGKVEILFDLNGIDGFQPYTKDILIAAELVEGHNCIPWDGFDAFGDLVPYTMAVRLEANFYNGLTHMPLYDVEANNNGYIVEIVRPKTDLKYPKMFWDDTNVGGELNLFGCDDTTGCHKWDIGNCAQNNPPANCSNGDMRTINTWWYASTVSTDAYLDFITPQVNANASTPFGKNDSLLCYQDSVQLFGEYLHCEYAIWSGGDGQFIPSDTSMDAIYVFTQEELNNKSVTLILTTVNAECFPVSDSITIDFFDEYIIDFTASPRDGCIPVEVEFEDISGETRTVNWHWDFGDGNYSDEKNPFNTYIFDGEYDVSLTTIDSLGCELFLKLNDYIVTWPIPEADISASPIEALINTPTIIFDSESEVDVWYWDFGDGEFSDNSPPVSHKYPRVGAEYTALLIVENQYGCKDTTSIDVVVIDDILVFANIITPNADGVNDNFVIVNVDRHPNNKLVVFNRWGKVVYEKENYNNDWDGGNLADGVYYYIFYYDDDKTYSASLTIMRK